ncbi:MAG: DUF5702 domain-containing protein [Clostridiales bacterium]|nr:DUF5702 domain-containing protein [Clostridiales bacterium]
MKRGSITAFLALLLSFVLLLVTTGIKSVQMASARTQILNGMDIGLYSLFGQYDKKMLEDYDLFVLDGSGGSGKLNLASVYDNFESYMEPVLKQNNQSLSIVQGGISGYRLLTDGNGEVFYSQAVAYMRETLGTQGIRLLLNRLENRETQTAQAEKMGELTQDSSSLDSYETEMNAAARESKEAEGQQQQASSDNFGDGNSTGFSDEVPAKTVNPVTVIRRVMKMGILELVISGNRGISGGRTDKNTLVSGRSLAQGMAMGTGAKEDNSYTSQALFVTYLTDKLGNYLEPASSGLKYQTEYIIGGKSSDQENLSAVASRLLLIREGVNFAHLMVDGTKRSQAAALAVAIASGFLVPPAAGVIQAAILLCWAFAESVLDVRELFDGGKVPLVKAAADWQISLENLPDLLGGLDTMRRGNSSGMSYQDYLQVLLFSAGRNVKIQRGMDMIELSVRALTGRENFRLDTCITAMEASVDVRANSSKIFTVTRQYVYD